MKSLMGIPFRAIITTNFDLLIRGIPPTPAVYRRLLREKPPSPWRQELMKIALEIAH